MKIIIASIVIAVFSTTLFAMPAAQSSKEFQIATSCAVVTKMLDKPHENEMYMNRAITEIRKGNGTMALVQGASKDIGEAVAQNGDAMLHHLYKTLCK